MFNGFLLGTNWSHVAANLFKCTLCFLVYYVYLGFGFCEAWPGLVMNGITGRESARLFVTVIFYCNTVLYWTELN